MKNIISFLFLVSISCGSFSIAHGAHHLESKDWISLFNGKDLHIAVVFGVGKSFVEVVELDSLVGIVPVHRLHARIAPQEGGTGEAAAHEDGMMPL